MYRAFSMEHFTLNTRKVLRSAPALYFELQLYASIHLPAEGPCSLVHRENFCALANVEFLLNCLQKGLAHLRIYERGSWQFRGIVKIRNFSNYEKMEQKRSKNIHILRNDARAPHEYYTLAIRSPYQTSNMCVFYWQLYFEQPRSPTVLGVLHS